jgi:hypothetical protein
MTTLIKRQYKSIFGSATMWAHNVIENRTLIILIVMIFTQRSIAKLHDARETLITYASLSM